jgi:hypothetical protein
VQLLPSAVKPLGVKKFGKHPLLIVIEKFEIINANDCGTVGILS